MDDIDETSFSEKAEGQSSFILMPSQEETQQESQVDKQMVKILKKLPALQNPDRVSQSETSDTYTDEEHGRGKAAVLVSDTDSVNKTDANNDPSDIASDSDLEEDITVIQKKSGERTVEETESDVQKALKSTGSSDSSGSKGSSSFQSRNRSNLGSYDQCEVYKTQKAHAKGDRFELFPASQDMFEETEEHSNVSTPAEHLGSLHLSQKPMLVPESVDETLNEIPPSPGVYGSTPIIIPSSPTQETGDQSSGNQSSVSEDGNQTVFDVNAAQTLASQPKEYSPEKSSSGENKQKSESLKESPRPESEQQYESLELDLSAGTLNSDKPVEETRQKSGKVSGLQPPPSSQKLLVPQSCGSEADVIVINSGSASVTPEKEAEGCDDLVLHLSLTETGTTQGHKSQLLSTTQGQRSELPSTTQDQSSVQLIDQKDRNLETSQKKSQGRGSSQDNMGKGIRSQGSHFSRSQERAQTSGSHQRSQIAKKSKREKEIEKMNDYPLVEWKNESDGERKEEMSVKSSNRFSDEFHLAVPGDVLTAEHHVAMETERTQEKTGMTQQTLSLPQAAQENVRESMLDTLRFVTTSTGEQEKDKLSIGMIQSQSEHTENTEPVFKLQKPHMEEFNLLEESEDVFPRAVPRQKGHQRLIIEDSDEEEDLNLHSGDSKKVATSVHVDRSESLDNEEEILVATKLGSQKMEESTEMTKSHQPEVTSAPGDQNMKQKPVEHAESRSPQKSVEGSASAETEGIRRTRRLTESSTQTADGKVTEGFEADINVVQKVAEYLQTGVTPRSRSSSTCTELSDLHGDGSEKGDNQIKTPHRKDRADKMRTPTPKSPQEIQNIIRTYSDILSKKQKHKQKSDDRNVLSSQKPNPAESVVNIKEKLVPRRLSSQSLPEDLMRNKGQTPSGSHLGISEPWMTARKPLQTQLSVDSDTKSDKYSDISTPRKGFSHTNETGVTQQLSESFRQGSEQVIGEPVNISQEKEENLVRVKDRSNKDQDGSDNQSSELGSVTKKLHIDMESKTPEKNLTRSENIAHTDKITTPSKQYKSCVKSSPFIPLERIDSPMKALSGSFKQTNGAKKDIPVGAENENFVQKLNVPSATSNKQKNMNLMVKEAFIVEPDKPRNTSSKKKETTVNPSKPSVLSDKSDTKQNRASFTEVRTEGIRQEANIPLQVENENIEDNSAQRLDTEVLPGRARCTKKPYYSKSLGNKRKVKRRLSAEKRNSLHRTGGGLSPPVVSNVGSLPSTSSTVSPQAVSGSFVATTQKFSPINQSDGQDPYSFHGTQSQGSMTKEKPENNECVPGKTPLSSRKRTRLQHKKSGLKKARQDTEDGENNSQTTHHVSFQTSPRISSQSSDTTVTTIGSLPSVPSSISQTSSMRETVLSPKSSSSRQSVSEEISTRLSGKRMSIEQVLPDTLPLTHSEEDNYQKVTVVIEKVERVYREITTTRKVIGPQGQILENTQDVKRLDPVIVEESTHKKAQYLYIPSPSRSVSSLTSGDLADVSSSLSRSSVSSGSLGSKIGSLSSSLDRNPSITKHLDTQISVEHPQSDQSRGEASKSSEAATEELNAAEIMAAPSALPRTKYHRQSSDKVSENQSVKSKQQHSQVEENQSNIVSGIQPLTPDSLNTGYQKEQTPGQNTESRNQSKPVTPVVQSDQEISDVQTPLGSTINKTGSYLHSRTSSVESPKASDSLFSTSSDDNKKTASILEGGQLSKKVDEETGTDTSLKENRSSDQVSSEIPYQDQHVSSSQSATPEESVAMVTSNGTIGSKVMARWKDGFYYPGTIKSTADRYGKHLVHFDDGSKMSVKGGDILLIERLPLRQSVMVMTEEGDFESGLITKTEEENYTVETDNGTSGRYTFSQVILSADQAECIVTDHGQDVIMSHNKPTCLPSNVGDVSLENLLDAPRRSATKKPPAAEVKVEDESQGQSGRGRKRKHDVLKPQATSTPTPKGKAESMLSKRRKMLTESPVIGIQSSPVPVMKKSLRKTRVDLFGKGLGPIPKKKIFRNISFLLTNVEKTKEQQDQEKKLIEDSSLDTSTDESATEEDNTVVFDKDHLKQQIEAGGGTVLETLDEKVVSTSKRRIILLSSSYQRTIKYLQCLASGIPCLSHMWLVDSCIQEHLLDEKSYVLPAGISLEKKKVMEWKKKNNVFQGIKAVVYSKNKRFVESWTQILAMAQCHVHEQLQYTDVHVIVTDNTCTATVQSGAEGHCIPLVGTEWVIQCLVNGRLMSYSGHPRYKHDFLI